MRYILSARNESLLKQFALRKVLLAFDFDGTLSPIVAEPDGAVIRDKTRDLLQKLTAQFPCIVVSGRSRSDVERRLKHVGLKEIVGNHGIEPWDESETAARTVETWIPLLKEKLAPLRGVILEDKQFSVSIHYRKSSNKKQAVAIIKNVIKTLSAARLIGGKQVINIVPEGMPNKGIAVEKERLKLHCECVIYVGDDQTDEDVFALAQPERFLTIRVGAKRSSLADFYIKRQAEIDRLLSCLIAFRSPIEYSRRQHAHPVDRAT